MKRGFVVGVWCLLLAPSVLTQTAPDFSGKWIVDQEKTARMRHQQPEPPHPPALYYEVTQTPETLMLEIKAIARPASGPREGASEVSTRSVYRLDGAETKNQPSVHDTDAKHAKSCRAEFGDGRLVATCTSSNPDSPLIKEVNTFRREDSWLVVTSQQTFNRKNNKEVELTAYWKRCN
jgi:hypothetical protein